MNTIITSCTMSAQDMFRAMSTLRYTSLLCITESFVGYVITGGVLCVWLIKRILPPTL